MNRFIPIKNKSLLLVFYSFGITVLIHCVTIFLVNYERILFSSFWILIGLLYLFKKFFDYHQKFYPVKVGNIITVRVILFIPLFILGFFYPIWKKLDLSQHYSTYLLIDDDTYYDDPYGDDDLSPYGENHSGFYSTFKYYTKIISDNSEIMIPEGRLIQNSNFGPFLINEFGEEIPVNISKCTSKEVAFLLGYSPLDKSINVNHIILPINYLWYILLKDGFYTLIFAMILVIYSKINSNKIFIS